MRWSAVLLFALGCKYPDPGAGVPSDDQPPDDADPEDGEPADTPDEPRCPEFTNADNKVQLPGIQVAGISVVEDESFAISWLSADKIGYTVAPLGENYEMTDLVNNVVGANVLGDGSALYLLDYNNTPRALRSVNNGDPAQWNPTTVSGLPDDQFPGRPTDGDDQVAFADEARGSVHEWERVAGTWTHKVTYSPAELGLDGTTEMLSANLSPDGAFLLLSAGGNSEPYGIYWRVRGVGGSFAVADGAYGGMLATGTYDQPHLTARCSHLFARNTATGYIDRFDIHP